MESRLLLMILLSVAPMASLAQYGRVTDSGEDDDNLVTYRCDPTELLILYNRSHDQVRMHCSQPLVCNTERTCVTSNAPVCEAKSQYLAGVQERPGGGVISTCCQITPPFDGDEPCYEIQVNDQSEQGDEGGLFRAAAPGAKPPPIPAAAPRTASHVPAPNPAPVQTYPSQSRPKTLVDKADLMLFELHDRHPPVELVKGIYKSANGYRVKICTPQCRSSTSTVTATSSSRTPSTPTRPVTDKPPKPTQQYDEHGAVDSVIINDVNNLGASGRKIRTLSGSYCQHGFEGCRTQCQTISGANFITASCKSADSSSSSSSRNTVGGSSRSKKQSDNGSSNTEHNSNSPQACVCTERQSENNENPNPNPPPAGRKVLGGRLGNGHACFSGDMLVETPSGQRRMDELHVGDQVLVLTAESQERYQPIEWFYHRDTAHVTEFVSLQTQSGRTLSLSPNHLIPLIHCAHKGISLEEMDKNVAISSFFASRAKVGHCVATLNGTRFIADPIARVHRERKRGIFSPITSQGTILVNGVQTSCYSSFENQSVQRTIHSVLIKANRMAQWVWQWISGVSKDAGHKMEDKDIPVVLAFLLEVAKTVLPSQVYA